MWQNVSTARNTPRVCSELLAPSTKKMPSVYRIGDRRRAVSLRFTGAFQCRAPKVIVEFPVEAAWKAQFAARMPNDWPAPPKHPSSSSAKARGCTTGSCLLFLFWLHRWFAPARRKPSALPIRRIWRITRWRLTRRRFASPTARVRTCRASCRPCLFCNCAATPACKVRWPSSACPSAAGPCRTFLITADCLGTICSWALPVSRYPARKLPPCRRWWRLPLRTPINRFTPTIAPVVIQAIDSGVRPCRCLVQVRP
jgi:hypothetical protein